MNKKLLFFFLIPFLGISQVQIGQSIGGESANDQSGSSLFLSEDGNVVAIGSTFNDGNGIDSGHVRIYENVSGIWTQIGQDIDGESAGDKSGRKIALSTDGKIVAIGSPYSDGNGIHSGHVRIYENISGIWTQLGQDIYGEATGDLSGIGLSLSSDGSIVAIGSPYNDGNGNAAGHVRIYKNVSGIWTQIGQDIEGEQAADFMGENLSLSSDGKIVAVGAIEGKTNGVNYGHVRVYQNISGIWSKIGQNIEGEAADDWAGWSLSLSANGDIVVVGSPFNDGKGNGAGHVRVYQNFAGTWVKVGNNIEGKAAGDNSGYSVSLSSDGETIAIGAIYNNDNGVKAGQVRIYKNILGIWTQFGQDINGNNSNDYFGYKTSLSADGNTLAIGAPGNDTNGVDSGQIRIYNLSNMLSSDSFVLENFNIYPNPTSYVLNISLENDLILQEVIIYNSLGQIVKKSNKTKIDVSSLSKGMYHAEVKTNKGKASKKIIIK